ncbi:hypothetical protein CALVIDRAFT_228277 [Calocera viscosa TUFC12733]|uniref:Uncharacterized protein n=1 Tax=Calocera viscosa (strain TUFC12733) TaxID=1330018 RepID=A0A167K3W6_CALVF|nr:hypothetical protein CALVIDRAFT_228277 [Calocera viscosa TUFC12733]
MRDVLCMGGNGLMRTDHVRKIDKARAEAQISFLHLFPLPPSRLMALGMDVSALCGSYRPAPGCSWLPSRFPLQGCCVPMPRSRQASYQLRLQRYDRVSIREHPNPLPSPFSAVSPSSVPPPIRRAARCPHQALARRRNVLPHLRVCWSLLSVGDRHLVRSRAAPTPSSSSLLPPPLAFAAVWVPCCSTPS